MRRRRRARGNVRAEHPSSGTRHACGPVRALRGLAALTARTLMQSFAFLQQQLHALDVATVAAFIFGSFPGLVVLVSAISILLLMYLALRSFVPPRRKRRARSRAMR